MPIQHLWELDLASVVPAVAGPKRPQDRIDLKVSVFWETRNPRQQQGMESPQTK